MIEISCDREYQLSLERIETLMNYGAVGMDPVTADELNDLVDAVEKWENKHYQIAAPSAIDASLFRAEQTEGLQMIVAISQNGAIGKDGRLPWRLPEDLKWFKRATVGKSIIMGRRTWDSLPYKPLPYRVNIVLTHKDLQDCICVQSIEDAIARAPTQPIIIGGAEVYEQAKHLVTTMFVTEVHREVPEPFTFLELDTEGWERTVLLEGEEFDIVRYTKSGK